MLSRVFLLVALLVFGGVTTVFADYPEPPVARLRAAHYVIDAPNVDVYVDGEIVFEDAAFLITTPYISLEEGSHTLTIVPAGEVVDAPVIEPIEIEVVGGHDYALALIGQIADESITSTLLDETELVAQVKSDDVEASYAVLLHGISDGPAVDFFMDGEALIENLEFGGYAPVAVTVEPHDIVVSFAGQPDEIVFQNSGETPPAGDFLLFTVMVGSYPDALDVTGAVTALPKGDVQSVLSGIEGHTFETLLAALEVVDLSAELADADVTFLAPTDEAFATLPEGALDALLADPDALKAVLLNHIVDETVTAPTFTETTDLTTLGGETVTVTAADETITLNDSAVIVAGDYPLANGNLVVIDSVLLPAE